MVCGDYKVVFSKLYEFFLDEILFQKGGGTYHTARTAMEILVEQLFDQFNQLI